MSIEEVRSRLADVWRQSTKRSEEQAGNWVNEELTKVFFLNPLFEALGWMENTLDLEPEFRPSSALADRVDYALKVEGNPVVFVEAKRLRENLTDQHRGQLLKYGPLTDVRFGVLTNGMDFEIYDLAQKGPIETSRLFAATFNISEEDVEAQCDRLFLLSKEAWTEGRLPTYARHSAALKGIREALVCKRRR